MARNRAPERLPKKGFALFEAKPSLQSPGSIEEHRDSRPRRDKGHRVPFLRRFAAGSVLGASKEMNRRRMRHEESKTAKQMRYPSDQPQTLHNRLVKQGPELLDP